MRRNTIVSFNNKIQALRALLGPLFPISHDYQTELDLENMESLAVDGALISKVQHGQQTYFTIQSKMPNHPLWLLSAEAHSVSCKLFDLVKASNKFKTLFKQCQMQRGEALLPDAKR